MERLRPSQWQRLKEIRLAALLDSPGAFLATYEKESEYSEGQWRAEFRRGTWHVRMHDGRAVGLLGVTGEPGAADDERVLEYIWVSPGTRRSHIAIEMVTAVLAGLHATGVHTVYLWVLDGNEGAARLYERLGFVTTNIRQPVEGRPGCFEERMVLSLDGRPDGFR